MQEYREQVAIIKSLNVFKIIFSSYPHERKQLIKKALLLRSTTVHTKIQVRKMNRKIN